MHITISCPCESFPLKTCFYIIILALFGKVLSFIPGSKTSRKIPTKGREYFPRIKEDQNPRARCRSTYSGNVEGIRHVHSIEDHGNNKSGGVVVSAKDEFLLNRRLKCLENRALLSLKSL